MQALRSNIAFLLLLCLVRTLLPEVLVLTLHAHNHTTVEPAYSSASASKDRALFSAKHQHCEVEKFYNAAFQLGPPVVVPHPRLAIGYAGALVPAAVRGVVGRLIRPFALRGPPCQA